LDEVSSTWRAGGRFEPAMPADERIGRLDAWHEAVVRALYKK
jgi:hypothetical protein